MLNTKCYISLKQSDLVALSALDTLQGIFKIRDISSLKRFRVLDINASIDIQQHFDATKKHLL